jgi:hypothetical protein
MGLIKIHRILVCSLVALIAMTMAGCTQSTTEAPTASSVAQAPAAAKPTIVISATKIPVKSFFDVKGSGFTPKSDLYSHLKKPDGNEYPVITMLSDDKGQFTHEIDTLLLQIGTHELWVVDSKTGASSNVATFDIHHN